MKKYLYIAFVAIVIACLGAGNASAQNRHIKDPAKYAAMSVDKKIDFWQEEIKKAKKSYEKLTKNLEKYEKEIAKLQSKGRDDNELREKISRTRYDLANLPKDLDKMKEVRDSLIVDTYILDIIYKPCPKDGGVIKNALKKIDIVCEDGSEFYEQFARDYRPLVANYSDLAKELRELLNDKIVINCLSELKPMTNDYLWMQIKGTKYYQFYVTRNRDDVRSIPYLDKIVDEMHKLSDGLGKLNPHEKKRAQELDRKRKSLHDQLNPGYQSTNDQIRDIFDGKGQAPRRTNNISRGNTSLGGNVSTGPVPSSRRR